MKAAKQSGVALVITLLMLSVITFLTVTFLAFSKRERASVGVSLTQKESRQMSDVALARAQSEIVARMMTVKDPVNNPELLNYDLMVSRTYASRYGFISNSADPAYSNIANVSYTYWDPNGSDSLRGSADPVQNIANLFYDPRVPVFVKTNENSPLDFRFYLDINRNGHFETNGYQRALGYDGKPINVSSTSTPIYVTNNYVGDPEWIGVLRNPEQRHSPSNQFVGRYAYLVLPVGKTLDINYIDNYHRFWLKNISGGTESMTSSSLINGFVRDQGVGSWELNLGAYLNEINSNYYKFTNYQYNYSTKNAGVLDNWNSGRPFADALDILRYRYQSNIYNISRPTNYFSSLTNHFGVWLNNNYSIAMTNNGIDDFGLGYTNYSDPPAVDYDTSTAYTSLGLNITSKPWAGSGNATNIFDLPSELWDTNKFPGFAANMAVTVTNLDSPARYAFTRLLSTMGSDSAPELQVDINNYNVNWERHNKVNINYDNTYEITNNLNEAVTDGTNALADWSPVAFFTNAADLILRQQFTNHIFRRVNNLLVYSTDTNYTNFTYDQEVHRCLQVAANIYDATQTGYTDAGNTNVCPTVFRPILQYKIKATNYGWYTEPAGLYIVGFTNNNTVDNLADRNGWFYKTNIFKFINDTTITTNDPVVWGIPWVVGAKKGLPNFNQLLVSNNVSLVRKFWFSHKSDVSTVCVDTTNSVYISEIIELGMKNAVGVEFRNPYSSALVRNLRIFVTNYPQIVLKGKSAILNRNGYLYTNGAPQNPLPFPWTTTNWSVATNISSWAGNSGSSANNSYFVPLYLTNDAILPGKWSYNATSNSLTFSQGAVTNNETFQEYQNSIPGAPDSAWTNLQVVVSNSVICVIADRDSGRVLDFVNFSAQFASNYLSQCSDYVTGDYRVFTNFFYPADNRTVCRGATNLIDLSLNPSKGTPSGVDYKAWTNQSTTLIEWWTNTKTNTPKSASAPELTFGFYRAFQANDPLVHYTIADLTDPRNIIYTNPVVGPAFFTTNARRYAPWRAANVLSPPLVTNMTLIDPNIRSSDDWVFPTNKFASVGWLGRVHRGTPWQTIFLKADPNWDGAIGNRYLWTNQWDGDMRSYPTNDWALPDLFTVAPNDNASRGTLSVNQTNIEAWAAVLAGVPILTSKLGSGAVVSPADVPALFYDSTSGSTIIRGINTVRNLTPTHLFHRTGEILQAESLTTGSPFVGDPTVNANISDAVVEAVPQRILSLLRVGQPRFVIYSYGQSLKPAGAYMGSGRNFNLVTNYQITGEALTRTVCRIERDAANNPKIVVESFNTVSGSDE